MPRLADVLLRDLQLDRLVGLLERAEERRRRLADLEIDRPVLDLHDDVVVELAVERRGSCRTRRGRDRSSGCASPCGGRRRSRDRRSRRRAAPARARPRWPRRRGVRPYCDGPTRPSESAFSTTPAKSGTRVELVHLRPPPARRPPDRADRRSQARRAFSGCRSRSRWRCERPTAGRRRRSATTCGISSVATARAGWR